MPLTNQAIFHRVRDHLLRQNAKSEQAVRINDLTTCAYRGDNGLRCAAGCLITDECYSSALEGESVVCRSVANALVCSGILSEADAAAAVEHGQTCQFNHDNRTPLRLISLLQGIHDANPVETWRFGLTALATEWGLTP